MFNNIWKEKKKEGSSGVSEFGVVFIIKGPLCKIGKITVRNGIEYTSPCLL